MQTAIRYIFKQYSPNRFAVLRVTRQQGKKYTHSHVEKTGEILLDQQAAEARVAELNSYESSCNEQTAKT